MKEGVRLAMNDALLRSDEAAAVVWLLTNGDRVDAIDGEHILKEDALTAANAARDCLSVACASVAGLADMTPRLASSVRLASAVSLALRRTVLLDNAAAGFLEEGSRSAAQLLNGSANERDLVPLLVNVKRGLDAVLDALGGEEWAELYVKLRVAWLSTESFSILDASDADADADADAVHELINLLACANRKSRQRTCSGFPFEAVSNVSGKQLQIPFYLIEDESLQLEPSLYLQISDDGSKAIIWSLEALVRADLEDFDFTLSPEFEWFCTAYDYACVSLTDSCSIVVPCNLDLNDGDAVRIRYDGVKFTIAKAS